MVDNPYVSVGRVIHEFRHFYGRHRELSQVSNNIRNRQCVSVVGIRRIGKSSLLQQLLDPEARLKYRLSEDIHCVYIDCAKFGGNSANEVYAGIMRQIFRELQKNRQAALLQRPGSTLSYFDFEENIFTLHEAGINLVLMLDEFETLGRNPHLDINFFLGLRALHTEHELTYVTASPQPIMELAFSHEEVISSPFPNIFDSVRLGLFSKSEALELIQVAGIFTPEVEDFLWNLTGGHPLALQYACSYAFQSQAETEKDLNRVARKTQVAMDKHYRYYWKHLSPDQKRILIAPAYFANKIEDNTPIENLFKDLITLNLLVKREDGDFGYAGRALAEFIRDEQTKDKSLQVLSTTDLVGQQLGKYRITEELGKGGMARVYKAYDPALHREVAIKVLLPHLASDEGFNNRFQREARAAAALRHNHIVRIHDFGHQDEFYYMVMEFIPGDTLHAHLASLGQMPLDDIVRIITQIGEALDYAHDEGLIHRDVKPINVMMRSSTKEAILTDFGLVKILEDTQSTSSGVIGTAAYMSPEQINKSSQIDRRADIYSLGVTLYEMTLGRVPFSGTTPEILMKHEMEIPPDPRQFRQDLPDYFTRVIERALTKEPEQRYQTVQEMLDALGSGKETV